MLENTQNTDNSIDIPIAMTNGHSESQSETSSMNAQNSNAMAVPIQEASMHGSEARSSRESSRLIGTVKWFNAKAGYGFITRSDTGEDIFIHYSGIGRKNPRHAMKSLGDGELVEFNLSATNVTGVGGRPVRGNPYVSYLPIRRTDSFASGDPAVVMPNHRYYRAIDTGNSRIPRIIPNWQRRF